MIEEIRNNMADIKNRQYFLLFKLFDKDESFIGNYTLRVNNTGFLSIVKNDLFKKGKRENREAQFKYSSNDKFGIVLLDYMISEIENPKALLSEYKLLETCEETKSLNLEDINVNTYIVFQSNYNHHGIATKFNHYRETVYDNKMLNTLAEEQLKYALKEDMTGAKINFENPKTDEIVSNLKAYIFDNFTRGSLLHKVSLNRNKIGLKHIKADPLVDTRLSKVLIDKLTNYEMYELSVIKNLDRYFNDYVVVRDVINLIFKANEEIQKRKEDKSKQLETKTKKHVPKKHN